MGFTWLVFAVWVPGAKIPSLRSNVYPSINHHKPPRFSFQSSIQQFVFGILYLVLISAPKQLIVKGNIKISTKKTSSIHTPEKRNSGELQKLVVWIRYFQVPCFFLGHVCTSVNEVVGNVHVWLLSGSTQACTTIMGYVLHKLAAISLQGWIDDMQHALDASAYDDGGGGATERSCLVRSTKKHPGKFRKCSKKWPSFSFKVGCGFGDGAFLKLWRQRMMRVFFSASFCLVYSPLQKWTQIRFGENDFSPFERDYVFRLWMFVGFQDQW